MSDEAEGAESFEQGLGRLEALVRQLEQGNQPLESALAAFEEGVGLLRRLHGQLAEVERRVEVLLRDADGVLRSREGEEEEGD